MKKFVFLLLTIAFTLSCTAKVTVTSDVTAKKHPPSIEKMSIDYDLTIQSAFMVYEHLVMIMPDKPPMFGIGYNYLETKQTIILSTIPARSQSSIKLPFIRQLRC